MKRTIIRSSLAALALFLSVTATYAAPAKDLVDLNQATRTELKTVPGITNTLAGRIIANRPYGSKAHLVTRGIISEQLYGKIKTQVFVGLTEKDLKKVLSK